MRAADSSPEGADPLPGWLRQHADFCDGVDAPLYGVLMRGLADDYEGSPGGAVRALCAPWASRPRGSVVQLRLLAALHRLVLQRRAPELATFYRSVGGAGDPSGAWPVARGVIEEHAAALRDELAVAPQTNEPGRSVALAVGLSVAAARTGLTRVRLLEIGASAGLNLHVDRFRVTSTSGRWTWGPPDSPVDLSGTVLDEQARGAAGDAGTWPAVTIVERAGCDVAPVDPLSADGRLWLSSFVWPDHVVRFRRLAGALEVARRAGPGAAPVENASADDWLQRRLAGRGEDGVLTVVWHSVMWQYLDDRTRERATEAIEDARRRGPLVHLALESATAPYDLAPSLSLDGEPVAGSPAHGVPLTLR